MDDDRYKGRSAQDTGQLPEEKPLSSEPPSEVNDTALGRYLNSLINSVRKGRGLALIEEDSDGRLRLKADGLERETETMRFNPRIFGYLPEGKLVEVKKLDELPLGAEFLLTDKTGETITRGRVNPDGLWEVFGDKPALKDVAANAVQRTTMEMPRAAAAVAGGVTDIFNPEAAESLFDAAEKMGKRMGKRIEQYKHFSPLDIMAMHAREMDVQNPELAASTIAGSLPFYAGFRAASMIGGVLGRGGASLRSGATPESIAQGGATATAEAGTEILEELTHAHSGLVNAGIDYDPFETIAMAGIGGFGSAALMEQGAKGVDKLVREYPRLAVLRGRAQNAKRLADAMQKITGSGGAGGGNVDEGKEFLKYLEKLAVWGGRREEVMRMSDAEVKANFGSLFDENMVAPEEIKNTVLDAADAFNLYAGKESKRGLSVSSQDLLDLAQGGSIYANGFIDQARTLLRLPHDASDEKVIEMIDEVSGNAVGIWRDFRQGAVLREAYPQIPVGKRDAIGSVDALRQMPIEEVVRGAPRLAQAIKSALKDGIIDENKGKDLIKALETNPVKALLAMKAIDGHRLIERLRYEPGFGRRMALMLKNEKLADDYWNLERGEDTTGWQRDIEQARKTDTNRSYFEERWRRSQVFEGEDRGGSAKEPAPLTTEQKHRDEIGTLKKIAAQMGKDWESYQKARQSVGIWLADIFGPDEAGIEEMLIPPRGQTWSAGFDAGIESLAQAQKDGKMTQADIPDNLVRLVREARDKLPEPKPKIPEAPPPPKPPETPPPAEPAPEPTAGASDDEVYRTEYPYELSAALAIAAAQIENLKNKKNGEAPIYLEEKEWDILRRSFKRIRIVEEKQNKVNERSLPIVVRAMALVFGKTETIRLSDTRIDENGHAVKYETMIRGKDSAFPWQDLLQEMHKAGLIDFEQRGGLSAGFKVKNSKLGPSATKVDIYISLPQFYPDPSKYASRADKTKLRREYIGKLKESLDKWSGQYESMFGKDHEQQDDLTEEQRHSILTAQIGKNEFI